MALCPLADEETQPNRYGSRGRESRGVNFPLPLHLSDNLNCQLSTVSQRRRCLGSEGKRKQSCSLASRSSLPATIDKIHHQAVCSETRTFLLRVRDTQDPQMPQASGEMW